MFDKADKPLISRKKFVNRGLRNLLWASYIIVFSLALGTFGNHFMAE